jgi:peptidoglycan/xylan/chitin deacetylase (PgdA/CDA1 family)
MFDGKMKAVTFSYDDGITQDQRLIHLLNRYGLKATFNLNSGYFGTAGALIRENVTVAHVRPRLEEIAGIYRGHEIAGHTLTHPSLPTLPQAEIIRQVEDDRKALSALCGYEVVGMAYPGGGINNDARTAEIIRTCTGMQYARTITCNGSFELQTDLFRFQPTVFHMDFEEMFRLGSEFLRMKPDRPQIFYIWGHTYEFDIADTWERMEEFCRMISGKDDIFYGTNREVLLAGRQEV